jgi:hypothetical protein
MQAAISAAVAFFQVVFFCEHNIAFGINIIIYPLYQFLHHE